jgi:hypothetical protein
MYRSASLLLVSAVFARHHTINLEANNSSSKNEIYLINLSPNDSIQFNAEYTVTSDYGWKIRQSATNVAEITKYDIVLPDGETVGDNS